MITPRQAVERLTSNSEFFYDEMTDLMHQIISSRVPPEQIAVILVSLRVKVETVSEITAAASVIREFATKIPLENADDLVDIVGTGGDGARTFDISTTPIFVAAAIGTRVAKHDGHSVSSSSGAADIMGQMGANLNLNPEQVTQNIQQTGIGFMSTPNHHSVMRYIVPVRCSLSFYSIFNILGPLTNPAGAINQLLGVFHIDLYGTLSRVLQQFGSKYVLAVYGKGGLDEITLTDKTRVAEPKDSKITGCDISPTDFDMEIHHSLDEVKIENTQESLQKVNEVLDGKVGAVRDIAVLNAAAALYAGDVVASLAGGVKATQEAVDSGKAKAKENESIEFGKQFA